MPCRDEKNKRNFLIFECAVFYHTTSIVEDQGFCMLLGIPKINVPACAGQFGQKTPNDASPVFPTRDFPKQRHIFVKFFSFFCNQVPSQIVIMSKRVINQGGYIMGSKEDGRRPKESCLGLILAFVVLTLLFIPVLSRG